MFRNRRMIFVIVFILLLAAGFWSVSRYPALSSKAAMTGLFADLNGDTHPDLMVGNDYKVPDTYYLGSGRDGFQKIEKADGIGNSHCIGCRVVIHYGSGGGKHQFREIKASGGFRSFDAPRAHFGPGDEDHPRAVEIIRSTGERTRLNREFPANRHYAIHRRGKGGAVRTGAAGG